MFDGMLRIMSESSRLWITREEVKNLKNFLQYVYVCTLSYLAKWVSSIWIYLPSLHSIKELLL